jgi:hypothetical protein
LVVAAIEHSLRLLQDPSKGWPERRHPDGRISGDSLRMTAFAVSVNKAKGIVHIQPPHR